MGFPVFLDTCTLFGETLNDLLLCLAEQHFFTPYWSDGVLDELQRILSLRIGGDKVQHRISLMKHTFPTATVTGYDKLTDTMTCDEGDRHVLAAAAYSPAQTLVTFNVKDFPSSSTAPLNIEVKHPDSFLLDLFDLSPGKATQICHLILSYYEHYPQTPEDYVSTLSKSGVPKFAERLYPALAALD